MATTFPRPNALFSRVGVVVLAAVLQVGFLKDAEPSETVLDHEQLNFREWTDSSGKHRTEAALLGFDDEQVRLKKKDGSIITVAIKKLNASDRQYVRSQPAAQDPAEEITVEPLEAAAMKVEEGAERVLQSPDVAAGLIAADESSGMESLATEDEPSEEGSEPVTSDIGEKPNTPGTAGTAEKTDDAQGQVAREPGSPPEKPQPAGGQPVPRSRTRFTLIGVVVVVTILILAIVIWSMMRRSRQRTASCREYEATVGGRRVDVLDFR